jgi:uncharacterized surface protein with fasciclin (FAS1) repeats
MKIKNQVIKVMIALVLSLSIFSCSDNDKIEIEKLPTILELAKADANFSLLVAALKKTALDTPSSSPFNSPGSFTVFAPNNDAFIAASTLYASETSINALTSAQTADLKKILQNHVISSGQRADDLITAGYSKTFAPAVGSTTMSIYVAKIGNDVIINGNSKVISADIDASNGVLHKVNKVITLPTVLDLAAANSNFSTLLSVVNSTTGTFGDQSIVKTVLNGATNALPLTIFAPTNLAFESALGTSGFIPTGVTASQVSTLLTYHVLTGNKTRSTLTEGLVANTNTVPVQTFKVLIAGVGGLRIEDKGLATKNISLVTVTDIQAVNGVIHVVNKVLQPVL